MQLIDTHCHLFMDPLRENVEGVLGRCREAEVNSLIVPAVETDSWRQVVELSRFDGVYPALGLHPWNADERLDIHMLESMLSTSCSVAIGEIGLDFRIDRPTPEVQIPAFRHQLELALKLDLPVILHCRGAFEEMLAILGESRFQTLKGVIHAYSRGPQLAARFLDLGFHLAFGGALTRQGAKRARRTASIVPLHRILLETDSPSIGMEGIPSDEVEPAHVRLVAESLSLLRNISLEDVAEITLDNASQLFRLQKP